MDLNFKKLKELFRDKSRDNLYQNLLNIGINCELSPRGVNEEKLFNPWYRRSLGVIKIKSNYSIKYINIIKQNGGKNNPPRWWYYFAIPDLQIIPIDKSIEIKSNRKKSAPLVGRVKSIEWEHNSNSKELSEIFTNNQDINSLSMELGNIKVQSLHDNFSGFSIELEFALRKKKLSINHWESLNKISKLCINNYL